ncbi:efflux RND transporter permease subunit [Prosthecomicrobium pneumaticum]|uniref:HAE1 family hydrophobic/amphiphilic exporter-1 n=1 Tax=Prosthecomicrobium pneumaticum TaxID=81895 RepID=A0A7W9FJM7_9HYPH|nr:efflux RND transporter permease subunit [Prosthecomicrobium pneumaticum]MBB5751751.1 HAE1 family hydrophobic/amphiphilic exporter-1 [Prosthecomicrobium pneumaticum]
MAHKSRSETGKDAPEGQTTPDEKLEAAGGGGFGGISALSVRRPVLAIVANLLIVVAGLAAIGSVEIRELPNVDQPVVTINTTYDGATPETVDKEITAVIEAAAAGVSGWSDIASTSQAGRSRVTVQFRDSVDINVAASDLRDAVGNVTRNLPDDADPPTIVKADSDGDAIMRLAVTAPGMPIEELTRLVDDQIVDRLTSVDGVAEVDVNGDRQPRISIYIDPMKLAAHGLTVVDLQNALGTVSLDVPAGSLADRDRSLLVRADASAKTPEEIAAIRIKGTTRVSDVADVVYGPADTISSLRINGATGVGLGIIRQAQSNTLDISKGIRAAIAELNASMPKGVQISVTSDDADFINGAFHEVERSLVLAIAIVIAVIFLFLGSLRATLIPAVTVPVSLLGTVAAMYLMGFSLNILTLLAIVLATGLVVDDAIVVLENIARRRHEGAGPRAAAVLGARQVFFAVLSTTATLAAVFIPISFFQGTAGRLFSEFGFVMAFSVILSAFVALTLAPMLASRMLKERAEGAGNLFTRFLGRIGRAGYRLYERLLDAALAAPAVVVVASIVFAGGAWLVFTNLANEITPPEDRGSLFIVVSTPQGSTVDYTQGQLALVEQAVQPILKSGEATALMTVAGRGSSNSGFVIATLAPWETRSRSQQEIAAELNRRLAGIPGVRASIRQSNSLGLRGGGQGLTFAVTGNSYDQIATGADALLAAMSRDPVFSQVQLNYEPNQPQLSVNIDRERAEDLGISLADVGTMVSTLLDGKDVGDYYVGDDKFDIIAQAPRGLIDDPADLENVQIRTASGVMVPLSSIVTVSEEAVAPTLARQSQKRAVPLTATLADGVDLGTAMTHATQLAGETLSPGLGIVFTGEARTLNETSSGVAQTFLFAVVVIILVLAAQFESFVAAAILFATVPFGVAAGLYSIALVGGSLNIYTQIGLVLLVGLMAKNGILIVEFANQLRDEGHSVRDAIRDACLIRLRPVLMTMIATVLGGLPLIIFGGAGAEARAALGWIMIGGLGFASLATLFLTPVVFLGLARFSKPRVAEEARLERELVAARALGRRETAETARPAKPAEEGDGMPLPIAAE